ncbi:MAG: class I SAM-dependent methyltransferase [Vicinamibacterales bacterium]
MRHDLPSLYESKGLDYFEQSRPEVRKYVPKAARRVLDVGCGAGTFGAAIAREQQAEVWGIEPNERASLRAAGRLYRVLNAPFGAGLGLPAGYFDAICFLDVLEHLPTPTEQLEYAKTLLAPGGRIVASIQNFRYFNNMWELLVRRSARYETQGIMDQTHLRIFTQSSIRLLFEEAGLIVEQLDGINPDRGGRKFALMNVLTLGWIADMRYLQFAVVARV